MQMQKSNILLSKASLTQEYRKTILFFVQNIKRNYYFMERAKAPDNNLKFTPEEKEAFAEDFYKNIQSNLASLRKNLQVFFQEFYLSSKFVDKLMQRFFGKFPKIKTLLH